MGPSEKEGSRSSELAVARSLAGDLTTTFTIPALIIQVSMVVALSSKAISSEIGENLQFSSLVPALLPILVWITCVRIRRNNNFRYLISFMSQFSIILTIVGLILLGIFYVGDEGALFLPSFAILIISTSMMIISVSENMDDSGFEWEGLVSTLMGGEDSGVMAVVPMVGKDKNESSILFKGVSKIKRSNVIVKGESEYSPLEYRTRKLGYLLRGSRGSRNIDWNPATAAGLYEQASGGFSIGAAKKVESQSLVTLMLAYLSEAGRWEVCGLPILSSGEANAKIEDPEEGKPPIIVKYRWTEEEVQETSRTILKSISEKEINRETLISNVGRTLGISKKSRPLLDLDGDGDVDLDDLFYLLDQNKDGKVNLLDVFYALGFGGTRQDDRLALQEAAGLVLIGSGQSSTINKHLCLAYLVCLSSIHKAKREGVSLTTWREICSFFPLVAKAISDKVEKSTEGQLGQEKIEENFGDRGIQGEDGRTPAGLWKIQPKIIEKYQMMVREAGAGKPRPVEQFTQKYDALLVKLTAKRRRSAVGKFFDECLTLTTSLMVNRIDTEPYGIENRDLLEKRKGTVIASSLILEVLNDYLFYFDRSGVRP